ncbi:MAG: hypothetical protein PHR20_02045 [Bacteroidales bacterium]|nr:hypothetical protein [Bacteroidales bacterium]
MKRFALALLLFISCCIIKAQSEIPLFAPGDSLQVAFNNYADILGKNVDKKEVTSLKNSFGKIVRDERCDVKFAAELCNGLNCLVAKDNKFNETAAFITAFEGMILSQYELSDCKSWIKHVCRSPLSAQDFKLWDDLFRHNIVAHTLYSRWQLEDADKISIELSNQQIPLIVFENADLVCPDNDSIIIHECSGKINFLTGIFSGKKGVIDWQKAGFDKDILYAKLPSGYSITLDNTSIVVDSVNLYHTKYLGRKFVTGKITDKCLQRAKGTNARYPKFTMHSENIFEIKDIFPNINFTGRFAIEGSQIIGFGDEKDKAEIDVYRNKKLLAVFKSKRFNIRNSRISSRASFVMFTQNDTISHDNVVMKYSFDTLVDNNIQSKLTINGDPENTGAPPFKSKYHKINIYCDNIVWTQGSDHIDFTPSSTFTHEGTAFFESNNFFSKKRFREFETADGINSIITLFQYTKKAGNEFYLYEYVDYCKKSAEQIKTNLLLFANLELIKYDLTNDKISVNQKLFDYVYAYSEKKDYDIISIYSFVKSGDNGSLNLDNDLLTINGVSSITFNEKDNVILFPYGNKVSVREEMNIEFAGYLQAGFVDYYVNSGVLDYHRNKFDLASIDSMSFFVTTDEYDIKGLPVVKKINSPIQNLSGFLEINMPFNKSGNMDYPEYPRFICNDSAFVYYDKTTTCNGVYARDRFYFLLDPFSVDSLRGFIPENILLKGKLVSAGIFEDIKESLTVMPDLSLGFVHYMPEGGQPIYSGKGRFYNTVTLSNDCFRGNGKLDYITAELKSADFMLYPDSAFAIVDRVLIEAQVGETEYPDVEGSTSSMLWDIASNTMSFNTIGGEPYKLYNNLLQLDGELRYSPEKMSAGGTLINGQGKITSGDFMLKQKVFTADSCSFDYYLPDGKYTSVEADNFSVYMDVEQKRGFFTAKVEEKAEIAFKENAYITKYDRFLWDIPRNELVLGDVNYLNTPEADSAIYIHLDTPPTKYLVKSTSKKAEGLEFFSQRGEYDCLTSSLTLQGIEFIEVSDAAIFPPGKSVVISVGGAMMPISKGHIVINREKRYHTLYDADATIKSRSQFTSSGYYNYIDITKTVTPIFMEAVTGTAETVTGKARISEINPLPLNPVVDFQGAITVTNEKSDINLNGYYRLKQACFANETWVQLSSGANPYNLRLPVNKNVKSDEGKEIFSGLNISNPGAMIYPVFLSTKKKTPDKCIFDIDGILSFKGNEYCITDTAAINVHNAPKHITLDAANCNMEGSGIFDIFEKLGRVSCPLTGDLRYNIYNDELVLSLSMFLNFHFNDKALNILAADLTATDWNLPYNETRYLQNLSYIMPAKSYNKYYNDMLNFGSSSEIPEILKSSLIISRADLKWDNERKIFYTEEPISIGAVNGKIVNKTVRGVVEISKAGGTESVSIMIYTNGIQGKSNKYFFYYINNSMFTFSTNDEFADLIRNDPQKARRIKRKKELPPYQYIISTSERLSQFEKRYHL